ncbi:hypothetical protein [Variovorax terrae]|uniref:Uncharacterized protein n=1 Tax=Variovorax terrae TaxID=2923278 RepID=A0A9X2ANG9_9BURK|nr:hypothetical protein [Variovorax terrae]MCJ0763760.1 hypothetical protein [Variovorax terrae]
MNIHQLSVQYSSEQDRLLVRINTTAGEELRLWLTRRLALALRPMLERVVAGQAVQPPAAAPRAPDSPAGKKMAEFQKEETLRQADFTTPYRERPASLPLGSEPLLVTEVQLTPLGTGQLQWSFQEQLPGVAQARGFQMALEPSLTHGFAHLLDHALQQSGWTEPVPASVTRPAAEPADRPRYLN